LAVKNLFVPVDRIRHLAVDAHNLCGKVRAVLFELIEDGDFFFLYPGGRSDGVDHVVKVADAFVHGEHAIFERKKLGIVVSDAPFEIVDQTGHSVDLARIQCYGRQIPTSDFMVVSVKSRVTHGDISLPAS
jgi:hypothetical protein